MLLGVVDAAGVPGWPVAFRGSSARAAGLVTPARLRGPRFVRVFPDVYVQAGDQPPDLALRSLAAYRMVEGRGVLSGYSAALLLGADCAPDPDVPAEVTVPGGGQRAHPGLRVHRDRLASGEITTAGGVCCTTAMRTAYDLARQEDLVEAVVAVDRLSNVHRFRPDLLLNFAVHYDGARGNDRVARVLAEVSPYSGSPMESRLRMVIVNGGLPRPRVQWPVQDVLARTVVWLDLAYPELNIGIEYEGELHATVERVLRDAGRYTRLVDRGWLIYRYTKNEVYRKPDLIVAELSRARGRATTNTRNEHGGEQPRRKQPWRSSRTSSAGSRRPLPLRSCH
jgi:very-short-patch-repair endonuclease